MDTQAKTDDAAENWWITLAAAQATPMPSGQRWVQFLAHGSMRLEYYAPVGHDGQTPHAQDELYVIARGSGWFVNGERRHPFSVGDVLFVPAGLVHRFEDFSDDLGVWVMFYGSEGGEAAP